jgi:hypothetical protein
VLALEGAGERNEMSGAVEPALETNRGIVCEEIADDILDPHCGLDLILVLLLFRVLAKPWGVGV